VQNYCKSNQPISLKLGVTSSSAVAKRPRNASCLSVVSFNSTKRRAQSFIVSYVGYRFITACCSVVFSVTLRLLVINISSSSPAVNKLRRLPASVINLPRSSGAVLITYGGRSADSTQRSQILA